MTSDPGLASLFESAGCDGFVHARPVDGRGEVAHRADDTVATASVFKVLVAVVAENPLAGGVLDPARRVRVPAAERSPGPVGLSLFRDEAELSVRDLVTLMLTISDNVATDALLRLVGLEEVAATAAALGLAQTRVGCLLQEMLDSVGREAGFASWAALEAGAADDDAAVLERIRRATALQPTAPLRTTARDMTRLLSAVWTDAAGPADACARVRFLMQRQVTRDRLARGFGPGVTVAAKSGAMFGVLRHEVGVVRFPEGDAYAVAVLTRCSDGSADERAVNAAIGEAAAGAVRRLRGED